MAQRALRQRTGLCSRLGCFEKSDVGDRGILAQGEHREPSQYTPELSRRARGVEIWAALRSGLYLTTVNRYLTTDEAVYILDNCQAKVLVTSRAMADVAAGLPQAKSQCKTWLMVDGAIDGYEDFDAAIWHIDH